MPTAEQIAEFRKFLSKDVSIICKNVFPEWNGEPHRLETEKIGVEFDNERIIYENLANDFEVWSVLTGKDAKARQIRYVLKNCAQNAKLAVNDTELNEVSKQNLLSILFNVFNILPKLLGDDSPANNGDKTDEGENDSKIDEQNEADRKIFDKYKEKIFPNGVGVAPFVLKFEDIKERLSDMGILEAKTAEDLRKSMTSLPQGQVIIDFLIEKLEENSIDFKYEQLKSTTRDVYIPILFHLFKIEYPKAEIAKKEDLPKEDTVEIKAQNLDLNVNFDDIQKIFACGKKTSPKEWNINNNVKFYKGMSVKIMDEFWINPELPIYMGLVGIINANDKTVAAVGALENYKVKDKILPHLIFKKDKIRFESFDESRNFTALFFPETEADFFNEGKWQTEEYVGEVYEVPVNIESTNPEIVDKTLCIDFGTSNTAAGAYGMFEDKQKINVAHFFDVSKNPAEPQNMLPTIVFVEDVTGEVPIFKFGYEAKAEIESSDYNTKATVFYEIKRFLNNPDKTIPLFDKDGNKFSREFTYREIIEAYLKYVITVAEEEFKVRFKKLHFTAPVKLKGNMMRVMQEIFESNPESSYELEQKSIDEALAIVYHFIAHRPESKNSGDIMILDCGGGTTDLASCHYELTQTKVGKNLTVETGFENGDVNFGGNNITYLILQMLKIKIAAHETEGKNIKMETLIPEDEAKILGLIDNPRNEKGEKITRRQATKNIYKKFQEAYDAAENIIPTRFNDYPGSAENPMVKRNFYFLWQMAEAIKIEFYKFNRVQVDFRSEGERKIAAPDLNKYYLFIKDEDGKLKRSSRPAEKAEMTVNEINRIICPVVYNVLNTVLDRFIGENVGESLQKLQTFWYRLSGQSCKIPMFHDLLKEFIPGKLIRNDDGGEERSVDSRVLKELCVKGSIEYIRDMKRGEIKPIIKPRPPQMIYSVNLVESNGNVIPLYDQKGNIKICFRDAGGTTEAEFKVLDVERVKKNGFTMEFKQVKQSTDFEKLKNYILNNSSLERNELKDTVFKEIYDLNLKEDNGGEPILCIFALPAKVNYGFNIFNVLVSEQNEKKEYKYGCRYKSYEDEELSTFFDGDK